MKRFAQTFLAVILASGLYFAVQYVIAAWQEPACAPPGCNVSIALVPSGAIMMFTESCPSEWTRFNALDGRFARGSDTYGATGGASTHTHLVQGGVGTFIAQNASPQGGANSVAGDHGHDFSTISNSSSNIPPYLDIIFCKKN
ncbi:MAG: hypothetical protein HYY55_02270 [Candidatus Niyogibacteria bacterium]|nr:MAG: hypothetical protein HYY55_02270 [Candidatus Niyogibacteria bacterium]